MRIEKINDNKIKVMIDSEEAKAWNVSFKNISENTPQVQEMFWTAIRLAEKNVDFSVNGAKLFVEAVKAEEEDGGFGMLITRVCSEDELKDAISNCSYRGRLKRTELKREQTAKSRKHIYRFRDFETVCAAVEEISELYAGESVLYKCDGVFYLYLIPAEGCLFYDAEALLLEFGSKVHSEQYTHGRLNEYGEKMIAKDAVEVMQEYFCLH